MTAASLRTLPYRPEDTGAMTYAMGLLCNTQAGSRDRLDAVRLIQRVLGDLMAPKTMGTVWEGYSRRRATPAVPDTVRTALCAAFPTKNADLDRELARTLAMIEDDDPATLARIADKLLPDSDPVEDVHYLIVIARMGGKRSAEITQRVADSLVSLDRQAGAAQDEPRETTGHCASAKCWPS